MSSVSASTACSSSGPSTRSSTSVPWLAASIITCMMFFASTSRPLPLILTLLSNSDAVATSFAVARACRPSLLIMVIGRRIMVRSDLFPGLQVWQFGMAYLHVVVFLPEVLTQLLAHIHRPVLAAGTTNGDGHIAAVAISKRRQPGIQEGLQVFNHLPASRLFLEKLDNRLIGADVFPEDGIPVGVRQAANIEDIVGIQWHTVFEAERLEQQGQFLVFPADHPLLHHVPEFVHGHARGVHIQVGKLGERLKKSLFAGNGFPE